MEHSTAIKYTDEHYLTRQDVAELLKNNLVDQIWRAITDYRNTYKFQYNLKRIERTNFDFIISPGILDKSNMLEREFLLLAKDYYMLDAKQSISTNKVLERYKINCWVKELNIFAINNGLKISETQIFEIIDSVEPKISALLSPLYGYYESLKFLDENSSFPINENLIKILWGKIDGSIILENENFYRSRELSTNSLNNFINKIYEGAPAERIKEHIDNLLDFINAGYYVSPFFLAATFYVYFTYISPLEHHSDEMASLLMLHIISLGKYGEASYIIPILSSLYKNKERINRLLSEVRRTGDITYGVSFILEILLDGIEEKRKELSEIEVPQPAAFQIVEVVKEVEKIVEIEVEKIIEKEVEILKQVPIYKDREIIKEVIKEVPVYRDREVIKEVIKEVPISNLGENSESEIFLKNTSKNENLSFNLFDDEINDDLIEIENKVVTKKEEEKPMVEVAVATKILKPYYPNEKLGMEDYAQELIERHPELKFNQALFLANHREPNKYFTIGQFKKELNCSYETARYSMEFLVALGYLIKESMKNKFIYRLNKEK